MFITAMATVAKLWKEPRCPSTDEWIKKMWSIYKMKYLAIRKDEYPTFVSTWMGLEEIMLSEISQAEKVNHHMVSLICGTEAIAWRTIGEGKNEGGEIRVGNKP